mgnify:FL=1
MKPTLAALCLAALPAFATAQGTPRPEAAELYFVNVEDGDTVD